MSYRVNDIESLLAVISSEEIMLNQRMLLEKQINDLINEDFDQLLQLLYRLDVDEKKIRTMLKQDSGSNAAGIITDLIIERQLQKIKSRQQYSRRDNDINEEDKW